MQYLSNIDAKLAAIFQPPSYATIPAAAVAVANPGAIIFVTGTNKPYYSNGTVWVDATPVVGAMLYKGTALATAAIPVGPANGDTYIFSSAGTTTWTTPNQAVETGDMAVYNGATWSIIQTNLTNATNAVAGVVRFATPAEITAGTTANAVTSVADTTAMMQSNKTTTVNGTAGATITGNGVLLSFPVVHSAGIGAAIHITNSTGADVVVDVTGRTATGFNVVFAIAPASGVTFTVYTK